MSDVVEKFHYDSSEDRLTIGRFQDVEPVIKECKGKFDYDNRRYSSETFNLAARIPVVVFEDWCNRNGIKFQEAINDDKILKRFVNDPDNKAFKVRPGRI